MQIVRFSELVPTPACDAPKIAPSQGACFSGGACNPVTGEPCGNLACDHWIANGEDVGYQCVNAGWATQPDPGPAPVLCEACDATKPMRCANTLGCLTSGRCARYCCDDDDCGGGSCDKDGVLGGVGVCLADDVIGIK